jgi:triphosphatase
MSLSISMRADPEHLLPLRPEMALATAADVMLLPACRQIELAWQQTLDTDAASGPHALRVGLRKLRVGLLILRDKDEDAGAVALRTSLVALARQVGRLRDLDVLIAEIAGPPVAAYAIAGGATLTGALSDERNAVRTALRKRLAGPKARALRATVANLPAIRATQIALARDGEKVGKLGRRDLKRRWRKLSALAAGIETATTEELHDIRKALKNLRYAFAHFAPFFEPKPAASFDAQLRALQSTFGYLNDVASAQTLLARLGTGAQPIEMACAIGYVLGWHSERASHTHALLLKQWDVLSASRIAADLAPR